MVPTFRSAIFVLVLACLSQPLFGQEAAEPVSGVGLPIDWSSRHVMHGAGVSSKMAFQEPRATYNWLLRHQEPRGRARAAGDGSTGSRKKNSIAVDWNFPLGNGAVAAGMFPAKYSFNAGSGALTLANCTSDFLVYLLNVAGSSSQPNIVRFNNIYAGTGGLCGALPSVITAHTVNTLDNGGTNPLNGVLQTSPVLSIDGTKVAFIETVTGNTRTCPGLGSNSTCSIFHVLTWGTTGTNGSWDNTNRVYSAVAPGATNNASLTTLSYSSSTNTFSSPWVDYRPGPTGDHAYFGDDNGRLYRTSCVFYCSIAPQIESGWPITVAGAGVKLSPPVHDAVSNKVFVGGSDGNLYLVDLALCPGVNCSIAGGGLKSVTVGSANQFGGVVDAAIVDATFQTVFAFAGDNGAGAGVMLQTNTSFTMTPIRFNMGSSAAFNIYAGALDDAYYQNILGGATVGGNIFACGSLGGSSQPDLYWVTFTKNAGNLSLANPPLMNGANSRANIPGNPGIGCTPLTAFKNGATDRLFFSQSSLPANKCVSGQPAGGCMMMYDITTPSSTIGNSPNATAVENLGTSGIIVDNASPSAQASSVYFSNQGTATCTTGVGVTTPSYCAIKLTQSALQ